MTLWIYVLSCVVCVFLGFFIQALMFSSSVDEMYRNAEEQASLYYEKYYKDEYDKKLKSLSEMTDIEIEKVRGNK